MWSGQNHNEMLETILLKTQVSNHSRNTTEGHENLNLFWTMAVPCKLTYSIQYFLIWACVMIWLKTQYAYCLLELKTMLSAWTNITIVMSTMTNCWYYRWVWWPWCCSDYSCYSRVPGTLTCFSYWEIAQLIYYYQSWGTCFHTRR